MLICPVCKNSITKEQSVYRCSNGHSFDIAKKGYVNLLLSGGGQHGDDRGMATARRAFLSSGYYRPLADKIADTAKGIVCDIGCGECYYSEAIAQRGHSVFGFDISKEILAAGAPRVRAAGITVAVASCKAIPLESGSIDCAVSVFAPFSEAEVARILKSDGIFVRVTPGEYHLKELKAAVYDNVRLNDAINFEVSGFEITKTERLRYTFTAKGDEIANLFTMTPYYYKTSPDDMAKLSEISALEITAEFDITVYKKILGT